MTNIMTKQYRGYFRNVEQVNLKLNKDKCHFRCTSVPFFGEIILHNGVKSDPQKIKATMEMPHLK